MRRILESTVATLMGGLILWWVTVPVPPSVSLSPPVSLSQSLPLSQPGAESPPVSSAAGRFSVPTCSCPRGQARGQNRSFDSGHGHGGQPFAGRSGGEEISRTANGCQPRCSGRGERIDCRIAAEDDRVRALLHSRGIDSALRELRTFSRWRSDGLGTECGGTDGPGSAEVARADCGWAQAVGRKLRLPREFYFQCRYCADMPDVTRGLFGWWKEPITSKVSFLDDRGVKHSIQWTIGCGNDIARLNPLGSSSLYAKKYYHAIKLPDGKSNEVTALQPIGALRINRENDSVTVLLDGQAAVTGTIGQMGQLVGFEISVIKGNSGTLSLAEFKIGR